MYLTMAQLLAYQRTKTEKENILKNHGLHGIKVRQDIWPFFG
jgi:hypothetical protein